MGFLILLGFIALAALSIWARNAFWKAANQKVIMRKSHARGQSAIKATTTFVVPGSSAAAVVSTVVDTLGYPRTKRAVAGEMVLLDTTDSSASFSLANKFHESWVSRLLVADEADGAHGSYQVLRWTLNDGIALGSKEMEIVARRVSEVITGMGGTVTIQVPE